MEEARMTPKLLDVVALLNDVSEEKLVRGQVGTIVEELDGDVYEVEFSDNDGRTYATTTLPANQLLVLRHEAVAAA
jgi:membrane protein implicated in regulation of membrane protease activity